MIEIALQKNNRGILQKDIAKNQGVSEKYLDHIISTLKAAGLIINVTNKGSGYMLVKPASEITTLDIYKAFNAKVALVECLEKGRDCNREEWCSAHEFWQELNASVAEKMNSCTLKELAERQERLNSVCL